MRNLMMILALGCFTIAAFGQSVETFIEMARENNPGLKALELEYRAAQNVANQKGDYPDPRVNLGIGVLPIETRLGAQRLKIGVSQSIPWKGLLDSRKDLAASQAEIKASLGDVKEIDIAYAIREAYARLIFLHEKVKIIQQRFEVLDALESIAKSAVRSGKGKLSNVLFVERTREMLHEDIALLQKEKEQPTITINRWAGRSLNETIIVTAQKEAAPELIPLYAYAERNHPRLRVFENQVMASNRAIDLTRLEQKPKIALGLEYGWINKRNSIELSGNGRDVLMPVGSIVIPLHTGRFDAIRQEEKIKQESILARAADVKEMYRAEITKALSMIEYGDRNIEKFDNLVEITQETLILMRTEYASEGTRFEELLRLEMELIDYALEKAKSEYYKDLARAVMFKYVE